MNAEPKGMPGLTDTERQFSELVFAPYHSNPHPGGSDDLARNLRGDEAWLAPEHADKVGEVAGFYITPAHPKVFVHEGGVEVGSISDILQKLLKPTLSDLLEHPPGFGINPLALWTRAFVLLQEYYSEVEFDQADDDNFRLGIRVNVDGALLEVLREANLLEEIEHSRRGRLGLQSRWH